MAVEQWSERVLLHRTSDKRKNKRFVACMVSLLLLFCVDITVCLVNPGTKHKIDANGFLSPWDRSLAPPPYMHRDQVKVVQKRPVKTQPQLAAVPSQQEDNEYSSSRYTSNTKYSHRRWRSKNASYKTKRMLANVPIERTTALVQTQKHLDADIGTVR